MSQILRLLVVFVVLVSVNAGLLDLFDQKGAPTAAPGAVLEERQAPDGEGLEPTEDCDCECDGQEVVDGDGETADNSTDAAEGRVKRQCGCGYGYCGCVTAAPGKKKSQPEILIVPMPMGPPPAPVAPVAAPAPALPPSAISLPTSADLDGLNIADNSPCDRLRLILTLTNQMKGLKLIEIGNQCIVQVDDSA